MEEERTGRGVMYATRDVHIESISKKAVHRSFSHTFFPDFLLLCTILATITSNYNHVRGFNALMGLCFGRECSLRKGERSK